MRIRWLATGAALITFLAGCPENDGEDPPVFNNLPMVEASLNDADPLTDGATLRVHVTDLDGEQCSLGVEFSTDDGLSYEPATIMQSTVNLHELACNEVGAPETLVWDTASDLVGSVATRALLRFQAEDPTEAGPPRHVTIPLVTSDSVVGGDYVVRPNATGAQWGWVQMFLINVEVSDAGVETTGLVLDGDDTFIENPAPPHAWQYTLPTPPPESHFYELDTSGQGGPGGAGEAAFYIPTAYRDEDTSGMFAHGDPLLGVPHQAMVAYIRPQGSWIEEGWHIVEYDVFETDTTMVPRPIDTPLPILLKSYPVEDGTLSLATDTTSVDLQPRRCGLMPAVTGGAIPSQNYEMTSVAFDPIPDPLEMAVDKGWIKPGHWVTTDEWPNFATEFAEETFHLYVDANANDKADAGEPVSHIGLHQADGRVLQLYYLGGEMTWDNLFLWTIDECWRGFNLVTFPEEVIPKPPDPPYLRYQCHPLDPSLTLLFHQL